MTVLFHNLIRDALVKNDPGAARFAGKKILLVLVGDTVTTKVDKRVGLKVLCEKVRNARRLQGGHLGPELRDTLLIANGICVSMTVSFIIVRSRSVLSISVVLP